MEPKKRLHLAISFFVIMAVFVYVFTSLLGLNLVRYYPVINEWSVTPLEGPSMGYYGKVLFTLPIAAALAILFYFFIPLLEKKFCVDGHGFKGATIISLLFGSFFYIAEEWHKWGLDKMGRITPEFFNSELNSFIIITALFIILFLFILWVEQKCSQDKIC